MKLKKRTLTLAVSLLLMGLMLTGCSGNSSDSTGLDSFTGEWSCEETTLEDQDCYTGYYALSVYEDGTFSIYDCEAGNPGIAGTMTVDSDTEITVDCDTGDFDPPSGWLGMSEKQTLQYEFTDEDELHLIYTSDDGTSTLVFHRDADEE